MKNTTKPGTKLNDLIKAFKVYKLNVTDNWVTILIPIHEFNDAALIAKMNFYSSLGYKVEKI